MKKPYVSGSDPSGSHLIREKEQMENEANFSMIMLLNFISTRQFFISLSKNHSARPLLIGKGVLE